MSEFVMPLLLGLDVPSLTMSLVNIASPAGAETALADSIEAALRPLPHLTIERTGDTVTARTGAGQGELVAVVARLDTAPLATEPLAYVEMGRLVGPGAAGAKGALAVALKVAACGGLARDVTFVFAAGEAADVPAVDVTLRALPTNLAVVGSPGSPLAQRLVELTDAPAADGPSSVLSFGPGDPSVVGTPDEFVPTAELTQCEFVLRTWLAK